VQVAELGRNISAATNSSSHGDTIGAVSVSKDKRGLFSTDDIYFGTVTQVIGNLDFDGATISPGDATMKRLERVAGAVNFESCLGLTSLAFPRLRTVGGYLFIDSNPQLTSLSFPSLLETGGYLSISNNPKLTALDFGSIQRVGASAIGVPDIGSGYLSFYNNNGNKPIASAVSCKRLKDACSAVPACRDYPDNNHAAAHLGPRMKNVCN